MAEDEKQKKGGIFSGNDDILSAVFSGSLVPPADPASFSEKRETRSGGESLSGSVEGIVYSNDDTGYVVTTFVTDDGDLVSMVGIMPGLNEGDKLTVIGKWENSAKYGKQFRVAEYRTEVPAGAEDLERYLASGAVKGIGRKTAKKIIREFGEDTEDVLENHPEWLAQIPGISMKRAREISEDFKGKADIRAAMTFFNGYLGSALSMQVYRQYGSHSIQIAKDNPYRLCDEVRGISFEKADKMAEMMGMEHTAAERICSGVCYVLNYNARMNGHTCLPEDKLAEAASATLEVDKELVEDAIRTLKKRGKLMSEKTSADVPAMIYEKTQFDDEKYIAGKLLKLKNGGFPLDIGDIEAFIRKEEAQNGIKYADEQKRAIFDALTCGALVLTGGPGTGKTTVVTALIGIFESMDMDVALAAPTGRAAKRMTEATGREAKTVHRLLEVDFSDVDDGAAGLGKSEAPLKFRKGEKDHLEENVIIVDEASMLDTALTAALLRAIKPGARLIFIGDADQLASVGSGNVLRDIIASGVIPTVSLTRIFRQAEMSLIVTNAHAINRGEMPVLDDRTRDFFFMPRDNDREISATVGDLCAVRLPRAYGDRDGIQVIAPSRKGGAGTEALNAALQARVNPRVPGKTETVFRSLIFREGDRVMQIRNNYELEWNRYGTYGQGIFNGDIGKITRIEPAEKYMEVDFDGRIVNYEFGDLEDLDLAYAITVHKSQGSGATRSLVKS